MAFTRKDRERLEKQAEEVMQSGLESLRRYGGNPELLLKENPHRDFERAAKERRKRD